MDNAVRARATVVVDGAQDATARVHGNVPADEEPAMAQDGQAVLDATREHEMEVGAGLAAGRVVVAARKDWSNDDDDDDGPMPESSSQGAPP